MKRHLLSLSLLVALASGAYAEDFAGEEFSGANQRAKLMPHYLAAKKDAALQALSAATVTSDRAAMDNLLARLPISPLDYLQIDMYLHRYEFAIPKYIGEAHARWIGLHEAKAREFYGDTYVDQILAGWPVDTGADEIGRASVSTNRNVASTNPTAPLDYQGEIQVVVNPANPNQLVAAANTWDNAGGLCNNAETQAVFYSSDGGNTWGYTCSPSSNAFSLGSCSGTVFGSDPALYWNDQGHVYLNYMLLCSSVLSTRYAMVVARSTNGGATWNAQGVIKNSWGTTDLEDKNFYIIDNTATSPFYGRHYTCWDRGNNEKIAYSTNSGVNWTEVDLPTAFAGGLDLGCEMAVGKDGTVHVIWDSLTCGASTCSNEQMYYTRSTNGGVSWSTPVMVRDFNLVSFSGANEPPVADNRGINPFGSIDIDNTGGACDGTLYVTYSDFASGTVADNDVWLTRSTNNGATWSTPVKVNDDGLAARIQFHPFMVVDRANGNVVVGWHDARNDSGNKRVDYFVARSTNCGVSFEANIQASANSAEFNNSAISYTNQNTTDNPNRNPNQYGEYMGVDAHAGKAYLAWVDTRHFYPGSSTNAQKENVGFAVVDFNAAGAVCGNGVVESGESCDGSNLNGATCVSLGFSGGTLSCSASCAFNTSACTAPPTTTTFTSVAADDGWVLENTETSNTGGSNNSTASTTSALRVGDATSDRQYKSFVSFDTSAIPDGSTIQTVQLRLLRGSLTGTNPFTTHGSMTADVSSAFGGAVALANGDFQAAASATAVCTLTNAASNGTWSECTFNAAGLAALNKTGKTQVRVYFTSDDNDDNGNDYVGYYSGNNGTAANRPQLVVTYQP